MSFNYERMEQLRNSDTNNNGNITYDEFCKHFFGDAIMFCGYKPDIYDQLGPIAPEGFLDVWYRLMDKDADEVASFEDVKRWDVENDKPLFKYNEDLYREYVWSEYVGGDKSEITFQEAFDFYNSTALKKAEFENGWYSLWGY